MLASRKRLLTLPAETLEIDEVVGEYWLAV
jgi:hypothetical protein